MDRRAGAVIINRTDATSSDDIPGGFARIVVDRSRSSWRSYFAAHDVVSTEPVAAKAMELPKTTILEKFRQQARTPLTAEYSYEDLEGER